MASFTPQKYSNSDYHFGQQFTPDNGLSSNDVNRIIQNILYLNKYTVATIAERDVLEVDAGFTCFVSETGLVYLYNGTSWKQITKYQIVSSVAAVAHPETGMQVYAVDLGMLLTYNGTNWKYADKYLVVPQTSSIVYPEEGIRCYSTSDKKEYLYTDGAWLETPRYTAEERTKLQSILTGANIRVNNAPTEPEAFIRYALRSTTTPNVFELVVMSADGGTEMDADDVGYLNTSSGLSAITVQDAIDEMMVRINAAEEAIDALESDVEILIDEAISSVKESTFESTILDIPNTGEGFINSLETKFHSTGGEGTPSEQIPLVNVSEWNKTVTGQNLFDISKLTNVSGSVSRVNNGISFEKTASNRFACTDVYLPAGTYTLSGDIIEYDNTYKPAVNADTGTGGFYLPASARNAFLNDGFCTFTIPNPIYRFNFYFENGNPNGTKFIVHNLMITKGSLSAKPAYSLYNGSNYPYRLEDTDGNLHYGGDLPDGTCDTVNWETGEFVERVKKIIFTSGAGWRYNDNSSYPELARVHYQDTSNKWGEGINRNTENLRCNIGGSSSVWSLYTAIVQQRSNDTMIHFTVTKSELGVVGGETAEQLNALAAAWVDNQISLHGNIEFQYELATPQTYQLKKNFVENGITYNKYPLPTLDGHTTIFTDANITLMAKEYAIAQRGESRVAKENKTGKPISFITKYEDVILPDGTFLPEKIDRMESDDNSATKLDKITLDESAPPQAYIALPNGAQGSKTITSEKIADSLALRDANSNIKVGSPVNDDDAVPKAWLVAQLQDPGFVNVLYSTLINSFMEANLYSRVYYQTNSNGAGWIDIGNPNPFDIAHSNWSPLIIRVTSAAQEPGHYYFGRSLQSFGIPSGDDLGTSTAYTMYSTNSSVLTPGSNLIFIMGASNDSGTNPMEPAVFYRASSSQHTFKVVQKNYLTGKEIVQSVTAESTSKDYYKMWVSCNCHIEVFAMPGRVRIISV